MNSLKNRAIQIFDAQELSEPLFWVYGIIQNVIVTQSDILIMDKSGFSWYKDKHKIGEFETYGLEPTPNFCETLKIIMRRDVLIQQILVPIANSSKKIVYRVNLSAVQELE